MSGVKVKLHNALSGEVFDLAEVPFETIDRIMPTLKHWGLGDTGGDFYDTDNLCGEFVIDADDGAYFQVNFE